MKTTGRLLVAACLLGAAAWFAERRADSTRVREAMSRRLLRGPVDGVTGLSVFARELRAECRLTNGTWRLAWPKNARVDEGAIRRVLAGLDAADRREVITARQLRSRGLGLADYGLAEPRARIVVESAGRTEEILLGNDAALGDGLYARLAADDGVIATSRELLALIPKSVADLRDRRIFQGDPSGATRVDILTLNSGRLQMVRGPDGWALQQPVAARADRAAVERLLASLFGVAIGRFVWDPEPPGAGTGQAPGAAPAAASAAYGLAADEAAARVTVWTDGAEGGQELLVGKRVPGEEGSVFAQVRGVESIFAVPDSILGILGVGADALRARDLFLPPPEAARYLRIRSGERSLALERSDRSGWMFLEPLRCKADDEVVRGALAGLARIRAVEFADGARTNLQSLGAGRPAFGVQVLDKAPEPARAAGAAPAAPGQEANAGLVWFAAPEPGGKTVLAWFADSPAVCRVEAEAVSRLGADPADPLAYRDRTVLAVIPDHVRRVTLGKAGRAQTVERGDDGGWRAASPTNWAIAEGAVDGLLLAAANLRATGIEAQNPTNLAAFGLDRSEVALTFGLRGEEGIQKTLILGFPSAAGGIYAMVQGQDLVYLLDGRIVREMVRDILLPPSAPAPAPGGGEPEQGESGPPGRGAG